MKRIQTATAVADKFGVGKPGFTNGDPVTGIPATDLDAAWFDHVQEALVRTREAAGIAVPADGDFGWMVAALNALYQVATLDAATKYKIGTAAGCLVQIEQ